MKKLFIIKLLFVILVFQAQAENEIVTIDGIKYQLDGGGYVSNGVHKWGDIEHYASIQDYTESEVSIPKSFVYNGIEYFVTCCEESPSNSGGVVRFEIQDEVTMCLASGLVPSTVKKLVIGKDVNLISTSVQFGGSSLEEIYCKDEIPMPLLSNLSYHSGKISLGVIQLGEPGIASRMNIKVYVPKGAERIYRHSIVWSSYINIIGSEECGYASNYGGGAIGAELINVQANYGDELVGIVNQETSVPIVVNSTSKIKSFTISVELPEKIVLTGELSNAIFPANENISIEATRNEDGIITINGIVNSEALEPGKNVLLNINVSTAWQNTYTVKLSNISLTTPNGETKSIPDSETKLVMQGVRGDMNGDGRVDLSDALYIINLATGLAE